MTKSATRIQDKDTQKRLSVVQSTEDPTKYGVVLLNPDGSRIRGPKGEPGDAATVEVGSTTTGNPGTSASVENSGSSSHAILNFTIPRGDKGDTGTISVGTTTTGEAGTSASVVNVGTSTDAIFNFTIPKGDKGDTGDAATIQVGTTSTGSAGTNASVNNSGTTSNAIFNFVIPRGDKGEPGDTGNGIINTVKNKVGKVTTVTFTYANGNTFDFSVSDGQDWEGSGDVLGPSSSSDGHLALFDGTSGKLLKNGGAIQDNLTTNVGTDVLSAKQGKVLKDAVDTINGKIPSEASTSNQLADKDFVNSSINSVAAYYITKNANGDQFATYSELASATTFYSGGVVRVPTQNDYTIVADDENHDHATTRYSYQGTQWEYQYTVNETALTQAQLNALNSGITAGKVSTYDGYASAIAGKQNTLESGVNIKTINNTSILGSGNIDTTYSNATQSTAGLMSSTDKTKLDGIEAQAQKNSITGVKGDAESTYRTGNVNITPANIGITNKAAASGGTADTLVTTGDKYNWNKKQNALTTQTAYTSKGSATKVPQITTNNLGQVTGITEVDIQAGETYNAGDGILIGAVHSDMQGPAPDGFHVPTSEEWQDLIDIYTGLGLSGYSNFSTYFKFSSMPGYRKNSNGAYDNTGPGYLWASNEFSSSRGYCLVLQYVVNRLTTSSYSKNAGLYVRGMKNEPVSPDNNWTIIFDGSSVATGAGIFHNSTLGLISASSDGINWITIQDKNVGATTVWNTGDTVTQANTGKTYQRGNNYAFDGKGGSNPTTSSTKVNASTYGPGNYYSSSTFITGSDGWDTTNNGNLWGGVSQGIWVTDGNTITNTGVLSVNGKTGAVSLTIPTITTTTCTLTSAGWSSNSQTVSVTGVTASNTVIVSPAPSDIGDYADCGVYCSAQGSGTLTFGCDTAPSGDIVVNVLIMS